MPRHFWQSGIRRDFTPKRAGRNLLPYLSFPSFAFSSGA
jgi:hypothetical protein